MIVLATFGTYGAVLPFISFSSEFIQQVQCYICTPTIHPAYRSHHTQKWGIDEVAASRITAALYFAATLVMVPAGFAIDRFGSLFIFSPTHDVFSQHSPKDIV